MWADQGESWEGPITVVNQEGLNPCEASIIQLPDGMLVCYMRENSGKGWPAPKAFSTDDGQSWDGPYDTVMPGCQRPVAGHLPSGDIMVTFRHRTGGNGPGHNNFWAYKEPVASAAAPDPAEQGGIIIPAGACLMMAPSSSSTTSWTTLTWRRYAATISARRISERNGRASFVRLCALWRSFFRNIFVYR